MGLIHIGDENKVGEWDMAYWLKKCSFWKNDQERPVHFFFFLWDWRTQTEATGNTKALRWEFAWHFLGQAKGPVQLDQGGGNRWDPRFNGTPG